MQAKENLKKNKGITLVALVVTIIILVILAGITVSSLLSDNGIIQKAREAGEQYEQAAEKESQMLANAEEQLNKMIVYIPRETGELEEAVNIPNYGRIVTNYEAKNLVWRLFYEDEKNIYLISETQEGDYPVDFIYICNFSNNKYSSIEEDYTSGACVSPQGQALMPLLGGKTSSIVGTNPSGINLFTTTNLGIGVCGASYLCNTKDDGPWAEYKTGLASWAMGGPTLELYAASFNVTHPTNQMVLSVNSFGYTSNFDSQSENMGLTTELGGIYRLRGEYAGSAGAWWIASPKGSNAMVAGIYDDMGIMGNFACSMPLCARPVVCISKSTGFTCQFAN